MEYIDQLSTQIKTGEEELPEEPGYFPEGHHLSFLKTAEQLEDFIGHWNGEDAQFVYDGDLFNEDDVAEANEVLENLQA